VGHVRSRPWDVVLVASCCRAASYLRRDPMSAMAGGLALLPQYCWVYFQFGMLGVDAGYVMYRNGQANLLRHLVE
jgi:hypothetical protein